MKATWHQKVLKPHLNSKMTCARANISGAITQILQYAIVAARL